MNRRQAAATAFEDTLAELGIDEDDLPLDDAARLGRRGALLAAAGTVWQGHLGPMYSTSQVIELLGVTTRQAIHDRVRRRRLLALPAERGELAYPAFQFADNGDPYSDLGPALDVLSEAALAPHTVASWFVTSQPVLDDRSPVEWMAAGKPREQLVDAARRTAARTGR